MSRCVLVFEEYIGGSQGRPSSEKQTKETEELISGLSADLKEIQNCKGRFKQTDAWLDAFEPWYIAQRETILPDIAYHPSFEHYCGRRHAYIIKLCMLLSLSRSNDLTMDLCDFENALEILESTESMMPFVYMQKDKNKYTTREQSINKLMKILENSPGFIIPQGELRKMYLMDGYSLRLMMDTIRQCEENGDVRVDANGTVIAIIGVKEDAEPKIHE